MGKLVSVIIPVFNVEKYLSTCVESVLNQTYNEIEVILVDDGSEDSSGAMCDQFAITDSRIRIVHKENAGLGYARNTGLEMANGEFVVFIDSDDYIDTRMIERLVNKSVETDSDTVFCGLTRVYEDGNEVCVPAFYNNRSFVGKQIIDNVLLEMVGSKPQDSEDANLFMSVWHALYSMDVVKQNDVRFPSEREIMCEDIMFHIKYLRYANKVTYISDCLYYYRVNPKSLSQVYDPTRFERQKTLSRAIIVELDKFVDSKEYLIREQRRLLGGARMQIQAIVSSRENNKLQLIKEICEDKEIEKILTTYPYQLNPAKHKYFNMCMKYKKIFLIYLLTLMKLRLH